MMLEKLSVKFPADDLRVEKVDRA